MNKEFKDIVLENKNIDSIVEIHKGDALEYMQRHIRLGNQVDCIITDPPYKLQEKFMGSGDKNGGFLSINKKDKENINEKIGFDTNMSYGDWLPLAYEWLKEDRYIFVMVNDFNLIEALNEFQKAGFHFTKLIIWKKPNKIVSPFLMQNKEYVIFGRKGKTPRIKDNGSIGLIDTRDENGVKITDVIETKHISHKDKLHNSQKPLDLLEPLVKMSTKEGWVVADPFVGSGSTAIASIKNGRHFMGAEVDEKYFNIASNRANELIEIIREHNEEGEEK